MISAPPGHAEHFADIVAGPRPRPPTITLISFAVAVLLIDLAAYLAFLLWIFPRGLARFQLEGHRLADGLLVLVEWLVSIPFGTPLARILNFHTWLLSPDD